MNTSDQLTKSSESAAPAQRIRVLSKTGEILIEAPVAGADFIAGFAESGLVAVPTAYVRELGEGEPPLQAQGKLVELLERQRQPVRIVTESDSFWLLNVQAPWIRVAARSGTLWLPLTAVCLVEFGAVDNQKLAG
jgi:hypothetical protein